MKDPTSMNLIYSRDNLQRMLTLQREVILQTIGSNSKEDQDIFPRSHAIRFLYSARGLLLAQMIFKQMIHNHPRTLAVIKTLGQLLLKDSSSKS
jgi:hypothetical protein